MTHHSSLDHAVSAGLKFTAFNPVHVPMTYTPPSAAVAAASANALDKAVEKIHNVAFIASNCGWWRDVIVAGVMQHLEVNSMGNCLQNAPSIPSASYSLPGSAKTQVDLKSYYTLFICFYLFTQSCIHSGTSSIQVRPEHRKRSHPRLRHRKILAASFGRCCPNWRMRALAK